MVTHPPRKTRFRLLVQLYRTGLVTRRIPSERFQVSIHSPFPSYLGARSSPVFGFRGIQNSLDHFDVLSQLTGLGQGTIDATNQVAYAVGGGSSRRPRLALVGWRRIDVGL